MIEPRSGVWWTDIDTTRGVPGIPFRALLAITLHRRIECCALQLRRRDTAEPQQPDWIDHGVAVDPDVIDADAEAEPHADFGLSAFTAQDINAAAVLPRWLPMAAANPTPSPPPKVATLRAHCRATWSTWSTQPRRCTAASVNSRPTFRSRSA